MDQKITYKLIRHIAILSERTNGWTKQLNLIAWGDKEPQYDIRDWSPDRSQVGNGVTLNAAELQSLSDALEDLEL